MGKWKVNDGSICGGDGGGDGDGGGEGVMMMVVVISQREGGEREGGHDDYEFWLLSLSLDVQRN